MFRIKDLILEEVEKEKVKEDCDTYIEKNRSLLEDDFHIWRVSGSGRDPHEIYKVPMRKRREIKGNKIITYFFRKFKSSGIPSRRSSFSAQGGDVSWRFEDQGTHFKLFPIGSNYKIYYHPDVEDFNYNDLHFEYTKRLNILDRIRRDLGFATYLGKQELEDFIDDPHRNEVTGMTRPTENYKQMLKDLGEKKIKQFLKKYFEANKEMLDDKYTFDKIDDFFSFLDKNRDEFEEYIPEGYEIYDSYTNYMKDYLSGYRGVQKLDRNMSNRELSVYAPDGVYYVGKHVDIL